MTNGAAHHLNTGWTAAQRMRSRGVETAQSHIERLHRDLPAHCRIVTVIDGHPATLPWIGSVRGHRTIPLGVEHFGRTGTIADLRRDFEIDAQAIVDRITGLTAGRRSFSRAAS